MFFGLESVFIKRKCQLCSLLQHKVQQLDRKSACAPGVVPINADWSQSGEIPTTTTAESFEVGLNATSPPTEAVSIL